MRPDLKLRLLESAGEYVLYLRADAGAGDTASGGWSSSSYSVGG